MMDQSIPKFVPSNTKLRGVNNLTEYQSGEIDGYGQAIVENRCKMISVCNKLMVIANALRYGSNSGIKDHDWWSAYADCLAGEIVTLSKNIGTGTFDDQ